MIKLLLVAVGGAVGSVARYQVGALTGRLLGLNWPYGTFTVNLTGGLLMGLLVGWLAQRSGAEQEQWRVLLGVGALGGFTTFSAFSLEVALMIEKRAYAQAFTYTTASVILSVAAVFAGMILARRMFSA
ncbi:MAG: fluoride efflux transporter CrcB [Caulobacter sp.]|nr:fluoride efflux transporter CrcB [Caulobacter sp.]